MRVDPHFPLGISWNNPYLNTPWYLTKSSLWGTTLAQLLGAPWSRRPGRRKTKAASGGYGSGLDPQLSIRSHTYKLVSAMEITGSTWLECDWVHVPTVSLVKSIHQKFLWASLTFQGQSREHPRILKEQIKQ